MELMDLLNIVSEREASDLHLVSGMPPMLRISGSLMPAFAPSENGEPESVLNASEIHSLITPYVTESQRFALEQRQDVLTSISGNKAEYRSSFFYDRNGLCASFRLVPSRIPSLADLFTPETEATLRSLIGRKRGLILVVGMTGSGKSTSIAAMIETINRERAERIITIEQVTEYLYTHKKSLISQRVVGLDVESHEQGGISVLTSDMDVLLIGELQTPEAVRIAIAGAETGHLVFSTLHAVSVSEAVQRLIEAFPDRPETMRRMIARNLNAVIAQRLVKRDKGIGRAPAHEILLVNSRVRKLIEEGQSDLTLAIEAGRGEGMQTMDDSILKLYQTGEINYDTAWDLIQQRELLGPRPLNSAETAIGQ